MKWTPHLYQIEAVKFLLGRAEAGLFLDPGLGKTSIVLAAIETLRSCYGMRALVVAPLHVVHNVWPAEVRKWDEFQHLRVAVLHGSGKVAASREDADLYVINYEGLAWLSRQRGFEWPEVLVADESTKLKNPSSQRFKLLKAVLNKFDRRYILTGTPVPNGLLDLWSQIYLLDGGQRLGRFVTHYKNRFFYRSGYGGYKWNLLPGAQKEIEERITDLVLREEKLLPPYVVNDVTVELPAESQKAYAALHRHLLAELSGGTITAVNAGAKIMKLRQVASGAVYDDDGETVVLHDAKFDALDAILSEREGQPTLVAYEYKHEAQRITARWPGAVVLGDLTPRAASAAIEAFNRGEIELLAVQSASACHGINLQRGSNCVVWLTLTYNRETYDQLIARVWRQGQGSRVVVHRILAKKTIDDAIVQALQAKDRVQTALLDALKELR